MELLPREYQGYLARTYLLLCGTVNGTVRAPITTMRLYHQAFLVHVEILAILNPVSLATPHALNNVDSILQ